MFKKKHELKLPGESDFTLEERLRMNLDEQKKAKDLLTVAEKHLASFEQNKRDSHEFTATSVENFLDEVKDLTAKQQFDRLCQAQKLVADQTLLSENIEKAQALIFSRRTELNRLAGEADKLRVAIRNRDLDAQVKAIVDAERDWAKTVNTALDLWDELKSLVAKMDENELNKRLQRLATNAECQLFSSHLKRSMLPRMPMFEAISRTMMLTGFGEPVLKQRSLEMYRQKDFFAQPAAGTVASHPSIERPAA